MIDGEPVVELDYPQLHPQLLYTLSGRRLQDDAYTLPGWDRNLAKVAFNILINACSYQEVVGAIANLKGRHGAISVPL